MNLADVIKIREEILKEVVSENFLGLIDLMAEFVDAVDGVLDEVIEEILETENDTDVDF